MSVSVESDCQSCGATLAEDAWFCQRCGSPVERDPGPEASAETEGEAAAPGPWELVRPWGRRVATGLLILVAAASFLFAVLVLLFEAFVEPA